jgi:antitoxin component YwqK of YwqJK toxin-antitoxin module
MTTTELLPEIKFKDNLIEQVICYYPNDTDKKILKVSNFHLGLRHGVTTEYFPNGKKSGEVTYKNGLIDGVCRTYYENGDVQKSVLFEKGRFVKVLINNTNGYEMEECALL